MAVLLAAIVALRHEVLLLTLSLLVAASVAACVDTAMMVVFPVAGREVCALLVDVLVLKGDVVDTLLPA